MERVLPAFLCLSVFGFLLLTKQGTSIETINIAGLFSCGPGRDNREVSVDGIVVRPAVEMAIEDINNRGDVLPGYKLQLYHNETECDVGLASRDLLHVIHEPPIKLVILGSGCSDVTQRIAEAASTWNLVTVSYGSTAPTLSDPSMYPLFLRVVPSDAAFNSARIALMKKFNWRRVGLIKQNDISYSMAVSLLQDELKKADIEVLTSETFTEDPTASVENLKKKDVKIIIGNFDERSARKVFCRAYHSGLVGSRYAWLIMGWYNKDWWKTNLKDEKIGCTEEQMGDAIQGYIGCDNVRLLLHDTVTVSGQALSEIMRRYNNKTNQRLDASDAGFAYDAVWAIALALNQTQEILTAATPPLSIENFTYADRDTSMAFYHSMLNTEFTGITGPVKFSSRGDRIGYIQIEQLQDGIERLVSLYIAQNDSIKNMEGAVHFVWQGGAPPMDHTKLSAELVTISSTLYGMMCALSSLCLLLATGFLALNIKLRHYRCIQMSSPRLNNTIIAGCIMMYITVFIFGIDGNTVSPELFSIACQVKTWLTSLGFTTAFGAMFVKTWRVYVIFTNAKLRKKVIQDEKLFLLIGILLFVDIFILSLWTGIDPLHRELTNRTIQRGDKVDILPQVEHCFSAHRTVWLGVLYAYKGILLLFGVFLAWETRNVKVAALNDSRLIGMSVYNVVILTVIGVPVSMVIEDSQNAAFALIALLTIFCTTVTLCLVFLPKFVEIKRNPSVLNTSTGTSTSASQTGTPGGSSAASHDKAMKGPKVIALAAENSNLKSLIAEKEEKIAELESRLRKVGVTPERIRRISQLSSKPNTQISVSSIGYPGDRAGSIHVEISPPLSEDKGKSPFERREAPITQQPITSKACLGHLELSRPAIPKKYSLPPRARTQVPSIEVRGRTRSVDETELEPAACEHSVFTAGENEDTCESIQATKRKTIQDLYVSDENENRSAEEVPTIKSIKGGLERKGSVVLVTKSRTGETCFQVKTPVIHSKGMRGDSRV